MVMDTSGLTSGMFGLLNSLFFWLAVALLLVGVTFGILIIRKSRKLSNPIIEITSLGRGKVGIKSGRKLKGGWFKHNSTFFGLFDYGHEEVFKLKDGREILNLSSEDFQEINGQMGIMVMRSPEDPKILVPINKVRCENDELLTKIAPAEYRGVVVDIIKKAEKETSDKLDKIMQYAFWGGMILFSFISIILITQMVKNGQTEAKDLMLQAGQINAEQIKIICQGVQHIGETVASSSGAP